ncbi:hypothetical protein MSMEI_4484 [Mycolicibacterium smegmatis MC2 155]|uniref:Uncharacterized protein n=1 Tax=Mycolicibacterium smegmatis (strain ATCC 700084 / mc(2)155) TaxID=246196 RepID=I7FQE5_MYCS2|nr:hypothetical protein MSMEI_4484 [Mycolicibacterium smegmatis MC2 155]
MKPGNERFPVTAHRAWSRKHCGQFLVIFRTYFSTGDIGDKRCYRLCGSTIDRCADIGNRRPGSIGGGGKFVVCGLVRRDAAHKFTGGRDELFVQDAHIPVRRLPHQSHGLIGRLSHCLSHSFIHRPLFRSPRTFRNAVIPVIPPDGLRDSRVLIENGIPCITGRIIGQDLHGTLIVSAGEFCIGILCPVPGRDSSAIWPDHKHCDHHRERDS